MQHNPYVYPFVPFEDLSNKNILDRFTKEKKVNFSEIQELVKKIPAPEPNIISEEIEDQILDIFLNDEYRFGPKEIVENDREFWHKELRFFLENNKPIEAIILGFPFKVPVPIKTNRTLPDMGEILVLHRLFTLTQKIGSVWEPGMRITIFTEGVFGEFSGISKDEAASYRIRLEKLIQELGFQGSLFVRDLEELESLAPDFRSRYEETIQTLKQKFFSKDEKILAMYEGAYPSIYRIVSTRDYPIETLMDVYNDHLPENALTPEIQKIRDDIKKRTHESIFSYHAYHQVRYDLGLMEQVFKHFLYLTVSPKAKRLGIYPISKDIIRLPYHSVPVWHEEKEKFSMEYLIDLKRKEGAFTKVFLEGEEDPEPFYYIVTK